MSGGRVLASDKSHSRNLDAPDAPVLPTWLAEVRSRRFHWPISPWLKPPPSSSTPGQSKNLQERFRPVGDENERARG
jgi:hypothetical protein